MKYFFDTEFHEYSKQPKFLGFNVGKAIDTIELISIGIISEDNREYYAICNEFDLKAAWNNEWLRKNVLQLIYVELVKNENQQCKIDNREFISEKINVKTFKWLLKRYGKSRKEIAQDIKEFVLHSVSVTNYDEKYVCSTDLYKSKPEFYAYYADYDWVVFCWLFGRMIDLPKGFPMYCKDLKQIADEIREATSKNTKFTVPKTEHHALGDAKWNKEFFNFLKQL